MGVPIFGNGMLNNHTMSSNANTGIAAHVHQFQQRQDELFASACRQIHQEAAIQRQGHQGTSSLSLHNQPAEHYYI
jgi:hypothetical protein